MLCLLAFLIVCLPSAFSQDFLLYAPTTSGTAGVLGRMGRSYASVTADQFSKLTVDDFKRYKAVVFGDPGCPTTPVGYLPTSNLANLFAAVDGNVMVVGTDELVHPAGGEPLLRSGLNFVAATPGKLGLYVSLSCYYHGGPLTPVAFLAPLTSGGRSFQVTGVGCYNDAHVVATSPAISGVNDGILSGWGCSVHQAFSTYPPEFIPLVIARNAPGPGGQSFADGTVGIPYIMVRGDSVSPINCGDGRVAAPEQCDSGTGCDVKCKCSTGYEANSPPAKDCKLINYCTSPGLSGKPDNVLSCVPLLNSRNITCKDGFYPSVHAAGGTLPWVVLSGTTSFGGCDLLNACSAYGFSGKTVGIDVCVPGVNIRTLSCKPGYRAEGGATPTSSSVTLTGSAPFLGCTPIDMCKEYGYSGKPENAASCTNALNSRTIQCKPGFYAVPPAVDTITITGPAAFDGCKQIDNCRVFGWESDPYVADCKNLINSRNITCKAGYWAQGESKNGVGTNVTQFLNAIPFIVLEDSAKFRGCSPICGNTRINPSNGEQCDGGSQCNPSCKCNVGYEPTAPISVNCFQTDNCAKYGWNKDPAYLSCVNGVNIRTITCLAGYWAMSTDPTINATQRSGAKQTITLTGDAKFAGCAQVDNCGLYGFNADKAVISCVNGINFRNVTCKPGYFAQSATNNATQFLKAIQWIKLTGNEPFLGCRDIDNCRLYGWNLDPNVKGCDSSVINQRTITCNPGWIVVPPGGKPGQGTQNYTIVAGNKPFPGCSPKCGDGRLLGSEKCDDGNLVDGDGCSSICKVEPGFNCGDASNVGHLCCKDLDVSLVEYGLKDKLKCWNNFWVSALPGTNRIFFDNPDVTFEFSSDLRLCGNIVLGDHRKTHLELSDQDRHHSMLVNGPAEVYGFVTVMGGGSLWFDPSPESNSSLTIWPPCQTAGENFTGGIQFTLAKDAGLAIANISWDQEELLEAGPFVRLMGGCALLDGDFYIQAEEIPTKSNVFPIVSTLEKNDLSCIDAPFTHIYYDLPGSSCSNIEIEVSTEQIQNAKKFGTVTAYGITNYKHLCNWHIGLISTGVFLGAAAAAAAAALLGGLMGTGETMEYVAL